MNNKVLEILILTMDTPFVISTHHDNINSYAIFSQPVVLDQFSNLKKLYLNNIHIPTDDLPTFTKYLGFSSLRTISFTGISFCIENNLEKIFA